jgi:hypothetical protein
MALIETNSLRKSAKRHSDARINEAALRRRDTRIDAI